MQKFDRLRRMKNHPLAALTAGLIAGAVLSSFSLTADADELSGWSPRTEASPRPKGFERPFGVRGDAEFSAPDLEQEISPDELANELGLPIEDGQPFRDGHGLARSVPKTRVVAPDRFKDFAVNVDVFRRSKSRPVLGEFRDEYAAVLVPNAEGMTEEARITEAKKRFENLSRREFAVASLHGVPFKAYIISAGLEKRVPVDAKDAEGNTIYDETGRKMTRMSMKTTPPGNYRLDPIPYLKKVRAADGTVATVPVAYPWIRSKTYHNSQMYWGLWIKGGYFIHSTPHYGELGIPASMGCIRQSFPDAQELFKLIVEQNLPGMIRIHPVGAKKAVSRLREIIVDLSFEAPADAPVMEAPIDPSKDMSWVLSQLQSNHQNIRDSIGYYGRELNIFGHDWIDGETRKPIATTWPTCGDIGGSAIDCFKVWGTKKPKNSLN